jgi:hypothetical protein
MKTFPTGHQPPPRRDLSDPRSSAGPVNQPRKSLLNDRRSTR